MPDEPKYTFDNSYGAAKKVSDLKSNFIGPLKIFVWSACIERLVELKLQLDLCVVFFTYDSAGQIRYWRNVGMPRK